MLNRDRFSTEQREIAARLEIQRLERDLEHMFRRVSRDQAILAIAEWHQRATSFRRSPPHIVDQLITAAAAYGRDSGTRTVDLRFIERAANKCLEVGNPVHMVWLDRIGDLEMLMPIMHREQIQLQLSANKSIYARMYILFLDLLDQNALVAIESEIGKSVANLLHGSYFSTLLSLVALKPSEPYRYLDNTAIEFYSRSGLLEGGLESIIELCGTPVIEFGEKYLTRIGGLSNIVHAKSLKPLLLDIPMLGLASGGSVMPVPNAVPYSLYWLLGSVARCSQCSQAYGTAFANYARKIVESLAPDDISRPDEQGGDDRRCDIKAVFNDYSMIIECKATRFTKNIITPSSIIRDSTTEKIASACEQLANTSDKNCVQVSIIVIDDNLSVPNSDWYWSMIYEEFDCVREHVEAIGMRPWVWSLDVLEAVVEASISSGISIPDIISMYQEQPYRVHGEWDTWLLRFRRQLNESTEVRLLDWKQACLDVHFTLEKSSFEK